MDLKLQKILYISRLMGQTSHASVSSFESLLRPNIFDTISVMLASPLISEDLYLCETTLVQKETEDKIANIYKKLCGESKSNKTLQLLDAIDKFLLGTDETTANEVHNAELEIETHLQYIERFLYEPLPHYFSGLDCNHGWMIYWLLNAYSLLRDGEIPENIKGPVSLKLKLLIIDGGRGGIAGGPNGQIGHAASAYASVLALALVEDYELLDAIKPHIYQWFLSLKTASGSYSMHYGGESDARSTYCVLSVAALLNMLTDEILDGTVEFLLSCQTYEGGFAGVPTTEAHGGYTFCALAGLYLTPNRLEGVNLDSLTRWLASRQLQLEGGFSGRTNKLVDACYSFWIGASCALTEAYLGIETLFDRSALKCYILNCCQDDAYGGLRDKPGKNPDFYHTNYTLCGLSITEHSYKSKDGFQLEAIEKNRDATLTAAVDPIFGIPAALVRKSFAHFYK